MKSETSKPFNFRDTGETISEIFSPQGGQEEYRVINAEISLNKLEDLFVVTWNEKKKGTERGWKGLERVGKGWKGLERVGKGWKRVGSEGWGTSVTPLNFNCSTKPPTK